ncbi:hypothetical protein AB0M45_05480 [Nocardia sp. NPDC051787]|uniref:hypothetical protein n=1 Tax=Nocardia sp. NPDC051787 TaxID=3155415 RepID=UPI0034302F1D
MIDTPVCGLRLLAMEIPIIPLLSGDLCGSSHFRKYPQVGRQAWLPVRSVSQQHTTPGESTQWVIGTVVPRRRMLTNGYERGEQMRARPTAIGYLRRDVSGVSQTSDEIQIRSIAKRLGYELAKTVVFGPETDSPLSRLLNVVRRVDARAVIVPGVQHLGWEVPPELVKVVDVITVNPQNTYTRLAPGFSDGRMFSPAEHGAWIRPQGR